MTNDEQIRRLVEAVMDTGGSPEAVCAEYPELLSEVRARWNQVREVGAQIDDLFPQQHATVQSCLSPDSPIGQSESPEFPEIPGYKVESLLGHGGMGVVYRARHLKLNRRVAVKMMLAGAYADPVEMARFQKEAEAVASLHHPHIVQIYDLGEFKGSPYFTVTHHPSATFSTGSGGSNPV